jgi:hypothetical protein
MQTDKDTIDQAAKNVKSTLIEYPAFLKKFASKLVIE